MPPKPLQLLTVKQNAVRQRVEAGQHGRAGGGQTRDRLKHRVGDGHLRFVRKEKRYGT